MTRLRRGKRKNKRNKKRLLIFFIVGIIIGAGLLIFYKIYAPRRVYYVPKAKAAPVYPKKVLPVPSFKIAIVLDDFGYNYKNVEATFSLKKPVTFSILPNLPYSKVIARRVHQKGYEGILHLPLEPYESDIHIRPEVNTITTTMKEEEVLRRFKKDIEDMPYIRGVSNHQGSKATENAALMKTIFMELKNKNLYFLDSLVTGKSVCRKISKEFGIKFIRRDVFLDNKEDFEYIKGQMQQLIRKAKKSGAAVGIGHDRAKTILALSKLMPEAEKEGVQFVFLSGLVK